MDEKTKNTSDLTPKTAPTTDIDPIKKTFWKSKYVKTGNFYISILKDTYRFIIPLSRTDILAEIQAANSVIISKGEYENKLDMYEIMFEDYSNRPYSLILDKGNFDFLPSEHNQKWHGKFEVYIFGQEKPVLHFNRVYYRLVKSLPCIDPVDKEIKK